MRQLRVEAPAKLNLHLHVGVRRPDGFHEIESLFLALAFGDILRFETTISPGTLAICMDYRLPDGEFPDLPPEKNIISRAVSLFRERTGYNEGLQVTVEKRIPLGGGLGGGSSDAAAALLALNRLSGNDGRGLLDNAALTEMGACLGSDVPFFLCGAPLAWVSGRGEKIQPIAMPESLRGLFFVLVSPGFPSDTAEAYRLLAEYRQKTDFLGAELPEYPCGIEAAVHTLSDLPRNWQFVNDFLPIFTANTAEKNVLNDLFSSYEHIFFRLRNMGAEFTGLSGSGSTCFGVFLDLGTANYAKETLKEYLPHIIVTFPLALQMK